jgi:aldehyde:ferredoxin oxidoreductase
MMRFVTGWELTADELRAVAQRIVQAKKRFNVLAGWTPEEDTLPERMLSTSLPEDPRSRLTKERLRSLISAYNLARGWSEDGWPPTGLSPHYGESQSASVRSR